MLARAAVLTDHIVIKDSLVFTWPTLSFTTCTSYLMLVVMEYTPGLRAWLSELLQVKLSSSFPAKRFCQHPTRSGFRNIKANVTLQA